MNLKMFKSLVIGSYLGDGCISKQQNSNSNCYLKIQHSYKQLEYAKWKANLFESLAKQPIIINGNNNKGQPYKSVAFSTKVHPFCTQLRQYYINGRKTIKKFMMTHLDELALTIWYLDDGNLSYRKKTRKDGSKYRYLGGIKIATCSFSNKECEILMDALKKKWDIDSKIYLTKGKYPVIWLNSTNGYKFLDIVSPFVPECMTYKIDIQREAPKQGDDVL